MTTLDTVFATKDYDIGDFLLIYRGERRKGTPEKDNGYIFDIPHKNEYIDAGNVESGLARFINDDFCKLNARPYEIVINSNSYIGLKAKQRLPSEMKLGTTTCVGEVMHNRSHGAQHKRQ